MSSLNLISINIQNFATFENQSIEFHHRFNGIVGETGSGKSLILESIQIALGHKVDKKIIRNGYDHAIVEAIFEFKSQEIHDYITNLGFPDIDGQIILKRIIYNNGKSKAFLNNLSANTQILHQFSKQYIDLVGQFDNQKLLTSKYQLHLLDAYADTNALLLDYKNLYQNFLQISSELDKYKKIANESVNKLDFVKFQIDQLTNLNPSVIEEEKLIEQKNEFINYENNYKIKDQIINCINGNDGQIGVIDGLKFIIKSISTNKLFSNNYSLQTITNCINELDEISFNLQKNSGSALDINFDEVIEKLDLYQKLKRKFNTDTSGLANLMLKLQSEYDELVNIENIVKKIEIEKDQILKKLLIMANKIHHIRIKSSEDLSNKLTEAIQILRMHGATIRIELTQTEDLNENGNSQLLLTAETNPGEGYFKLKDIASGGELSRILLAFRQIISSTDSISIFLFDEIDTGIGGETALHIGKVLKSVSANSQVIAITHLPQIAYQADALIHVEKNISGNKTFSYISHIKGQKVKELAKQMSILN